MVNIDTESGNPMQSAAKCPFLLSFVTVPWGGPGDVMSPEEAESTNTSMGLGLGVGGGGGVGGASSYKGSFTG